MLRRVVSTARVAVSSFVLGWNNLNTNDRELRIFFVSRREGDLAFATNEKLRVSNADPVDRVDPVCLVQSLTEHLWFEVPGRHGFINITPKIEELVSQSGVREGLCLVNAMHITASVFINDDEKGLHHDYEVWLEKLAPHEPTSVYRHNRTGEDNADAHLKRQIMGREVVVAITKGKLDLG